MPLGLTEVDHLILIEPAAARCNLVKEIPQKRRQKFARSFRSKTSDVGTWLSVGAEGGRKRCRPRLEALLELNQYSMPVPAPIFATLVLG